MDSVQIKKADLIQLLVEISDKRSASAGIERLISILGEDQQVQPVLSASAIAQWLGNNPGTGRMTATIPIQSSSGLGNSQSIASEVILALASALRGKPPRDDALPGARAAAETLKQVIAQVASESPTTLRLSQDASSAAQALNLSTQQLAKLDSASALIDTLKTSFEESKDLMQSVPASAAAEALIGILQAKSDMVVFDSISSITDAIATKLESEKLDTPEEAFEQIAGKIAIKLVSNGKKPTKDAVLSELTKAVKAKIEAIEDQDLSLGEETLGDND